MSTAAARPIYLTGPMGVGKSTIGRRLAERLGRDFLDTDKQIEKGAGCTIAEIFEREGEAHFRALETETIEALTDGNVVVALGGGALTHPQTLELLLARGEIMYLCAPAEVLLERIGDPETRPLLANLNDRERLIKVRQLLAERRASYERATHTIDATGEPAEVVENIVAALESRPSSA